MRRFAVVGNPIAHSKSPVIHAGFAEQCGHQIDYQKILVEPGEFDAVVTAFFDQGGERNSSRCGIYSLSC